VTQDCQKFFAVTNQETNHNLRLAGSIIIVGQVLRRFESWRTEATICAAIVNEYTFKSWPNCIKLHLERVVESQDVPVFVIKGNHY
jgi:hypothetical protein